MKDTINEAIAAGEAPTRARLREAVVEAAKSGLRQSRRNPNYEPPSPEWSAMMVVSGGCRRIMDEVRELDPRLVVAGFIDDGQRGRNLALIRECRDFLSRVLEVADA